MKSKAKRLGDYLQNELGWSVYDDSVRCPKCYSINYAAKYCKNCGTELPKPAKGKGLKDLVEALQYALGTEKRKW